MKIIEYEAVSWKIVVLSNEGYDLSDVERLLTEQGVRKGLIGVIKRHPSGHVADDWRQVRWHEEFRKGTKTLVIDLHRRLRRRQS